jgi:hypothetical protein
MGHGTDVRFDLDPAAFLADAAQSEAWTALDERHCLVLCRQLAGHGTKSLWLTRDSAGRLMLTADAGRPSEDQRARLNELHPKPTLEALYRLVVQLQATARERVPAKT